MAAVPCQSDVTGRAMRTDGPAGPSCEPLSELDYSDAVPGTNVLVGAS